MLLNSQTFLINASKLQGATELVGSQEIHRDCGPDIRSNDRLMYKAFPENKKFPTAANLNTILEKSREVAEFGLRKQGVGIRKQELILM